VAILLSLTLLNPDTRLNKAILLNNLDTLLNKAIPLNLSMPNLVLRELSLAPFL
jgi:hypothetical protein